MHYLHVLLDYWKMMSTRVAILTPPAVNVAGVFHALAVGYLPSECSYHSGEHNGGW